MRKVLSLNTWGKTPIELFEADLFAARNQWSIDQARRRERNVSAAISRAEAERRLKAALAALNAGDGDHG